MAQMGQGDRAGYYENGVADPWTGYPAEEVKFQEARCRATSMATPRTITSPPSTISISRSGSSGAAGAGAASGPADTVAAASLAGSVVGVACGSDARIPVTSPVLVIDEAADGVGAAPAAGGIDVAAGRANAG